MEDIFKYYPNDFKGLGYFLGVHHIYVDLTVLPVVHVCIKIPYAILAPLKSVLEALEIKGID